MSLRAQQRTFWDSVRTRPGPVELDQVFVSRGALSARDRLEIYRTAYWVRQVQGLRELFPSVVEALGDARFAQLASRFVHAHPSTHWALEFMGVPFVAWVRETSDFGGLAALDWARFVVFIAPDVTPLDREAVRQCELERWVVRVGPHVMAVGARCVWRRGFVVFEGDLTPGEANALQAALEGVPFTVWCQLVAEDDAHGPQVVLATLERWLSRGWLVTA